MFTRLSHVTLFVKDYDEAIRYYTEVIGLILCGDNPVGPGVRWVTVGVPGQPDVEIVLYLADETQGTHSTPIGKQTLIFASNNCRKDVEILRSRGVAITLEPEEVRWGVQAIFEDLYGNRHVIVEPPTKDGNADER